MKYIVYQMLRRALKKNKVCKGNKGHWGRRRERNIIGGSEKASLKRHQRESPHCGFLGKKILQVMGRVRAKALK